MPAGKSVVPALLRLGSRAPPVFVRVPSKNRNPTKNAGQVALAAMEEYSGAYMRLLHNVFRVARASFVLASDTPTTPVQAERDVTRSPTVQKCVRTNIEKICR